MNKVRDADFMTKFPPALQKDPSMSALGKIIAEELHITADNIKKNIIYAQIDGLAQTWLDMLAYDLHVDWYDYDYPLEAKRNIIKDSIKVHQKLGTKYAVETALQNVYKGAGVSEWFEYGGKPYFFKIMIDTGGAGLPASAYADILDKIQFYKNLRSHCDGVYIKLDGGNARLDAAAGAGIGAVLKIKARTAEFIHARESVHIMTAGSFGERLKVKPFLEKQVHARETVKVMAELSQGNSIRIKAQTAENLKGGVYKIMGDTRYFAIVTDLGTKEMLQAVNEERKVNITHFAVGDGGGACYTPDPAMTGLKNEVWRGKVGSCRISGESENVMVAESVIPSSEGGFTIREMAVFDDKNTMIALCNTPDTAKVRVTDGVVQELQVQMEILLNNKDSVQLVVDPNIVTATKKELTALKVVVEKNREMINSLVSIVCGYYYNSLERKITTFLPHQVQDGRLVFPEGAAYLDGGMVVLRGGAAAGWPAAPEGGAGTGSIQEIAAEAAKIVEDSMEQIVAAQAKELITGSRPSGPYNGREK